MTTEYNYQNTNLVKGAYDTPETTSRTLFQNLGMQDPSLQSQQQNRSMSPAYGQSNNASMLGNKPQQVTAEQLLDDANGSGSFDTRHHASYAALANQMNNTNNNMTKAYMDDAVAQDRNNIAWDRNDIARNDKSSGLGSGMSIFDRLGLGSQGSNLNYNNYNNQINSKKPDTTV